MLTDRWHRLEQLFTEAVERPPSARAEFLASACGADVALRDEVEALVTSVERSGRFLEATALDVLAREVSREGWAVKPGDRIGSYTVERRLGAGGVGEVWRAHDARLGRDVAIKLLLPHPADAQGRVRALQDEARAASSLNHTNVLTVYDFGDHGDAPYLVTECLEGESLRARLEKSALPVDEALDVGLQVARGLGAAHERGLVHRDLKPENIFLARDGRVKILDFGLATLHDAIRPEPLSSDLPVTSRSLVAGTAGYMAPEQVRGQAVDGRADLFALGAVLYEMLAGARPFKGDSTFAILGAVLTLEPPALAEVNPGVPPALSQIVSRCLAKSPERRFATVADLVTALESVARSRNLSPWASLHALLRRPAVSLTVLFVILAVAVSGWRWRVAQARVLWARSVAAPEVRRLTNRGDNVEAFLLAREALAAAPDDPHLNQLWLDASVPAVVATDPVGADVAFASYRAPTTWFPLGRTPLDGVRNPRALIRVRISKAGFQTVEASAFMPPQLYRLDPLDAVPAGMVRVLGGRDPLRFGLIGEIEDFWIDRFEITNRQFKEFVDLGGYRRREFWREPFIDGPRTVPWEEAVERLRDATGRPGPSTWTSGTYPEGQADFPVGGVSWYEAAAYAVFAGKSLPTVYHWYRAAKLGRFADILTVSNFGGKGPTAVGRSSGLGPFGTYDMAGNVKEWCWNETDNRHRFLLGGAWNEPRYMFADYDAREPFERKPGYGFRLAKYIRPLPPAEAAPVRIEALDRGVRKQRPVGDDIFAVYLRQYAYDPRPLHAEVEATEETESWRKHTVAFDAAYGERMRGYLFLPKNASPPYQAVVFFPAADAIQLRSSRDLSMALSAFVIGSGRALLYPIYKSTYERARSDDPGDRGGVAQRELLIAWSRDLGRAIDFLETRSDIDRARLAFYGVSLGAQVGVILTAVETRFKASVLQGAGLIEEAPEIDPLNYAPRVRVPTLLLNGRYDFEIPFETQQRPLFERLGTPAEHKKHAVLETGHAMPIDAVAGEVLPWLDRYLGPVVGASPESTPVQPQNEGRP